MVLISLFCPTALHGGRFYVTLTLTFVRQGRSIFVLPVLCLLESKSWRIQACIVDMSIVVENYFPPSYTRIHPGFWLSCGRDIVGLHVRYLLWL